MSAEDKFENQHRRIRNRILSREDQLYFNKDNRFRRLIGSIEKELRTIKRGKAIVASSPIVVNPPSGTVTLHADVSNAGSGKIITDTDRSLIYTHAPRHNTDGDDPLNVDGIQFDIANAPASTPEGMEWWNAIDHTKNLQTDTDTVIQVGQEVVVRIINKTGGELTNGEVVYINGADVAADRPTAIEADASTWEESQFTIGVMTSTVADDGEGFVTVIGLVRDVNTNGMTAGDRIYLSETTGAFTNVKPTSPAYIIDIGEVIKVGITDGIIFVHVNNNDDFGFFNGTFVESFDLTVAEDGGNIVASLQRSGGGNLTMRFSDGFSTLTTPPMTIQLDPGTATVPKANYLYILQSDKTQITKSNSSYPTGVEHIKVAKVVVFTAAITQNDDSLANQNVNDHAADNIPMGHLSHLGEWIREQPASWVSGVSGNSSTGDDYLEIEAGPVAIYLRSTAGAIRQLHLQSYPVKDTGSIDGGGSDWAYVVNDPDAAYTRVTELFAGIDKLSTGAGYSNNKYQIIVLWGIQNKSGEASQLMVNLASGEYTSQTGAENDVNGYTNATIPDEFKSTGFLICKLVFQKTATTWAYKSTLDLRRPSTIAAGASGGAAIVDFPDNTFNIFDDADPTKRILFQASGIAAGNDRTVTMADENVTLHNKYATADFANDYETKIKIPPYLHDFANDAILGNEGGVRVFLWPAADDNAFHAWNFKIPDDWTADKIDIVCIYSIEDGNAFSVAWTVGSLTTGASVGSQDNNVLNADVNNDFPAGVASEATQKIVQLDNANIDAGDILIVKCASDASNSAILNMVAIWLEVGTA